MLTTVADIHENMTRQRQTFAKATKLKFLVTRIDGRASQGCPDFAPNALRFVARSKPISAHTAWTSSKKIGEKLTSTAAVRKEKYIRPSNSKVFMRKQNQWKTHAWTIWKALSGCIFLVFVFKGCFYIFLEALCGCKTNKKLWKLITLENLFKAQRKTLCGWRNHIKTSENTHVGRWVSYKVKQLSTKTTLFGPSSAPASLN